MWTASARHQYRRTGGGCATDVTDAEYALIEPLLPPARHGGRRRTTVVREVLNALLYLLRTGCPPRAPPSHHQPRRHMAHRRTALPRPRGHRPSGAWRRLLWRLSLQLVEAEVERAGTTTIARRYYLCSTQPDAAPSLAPAVPTGHREPPALGPGRGLPRRPRPAQDRPRSAEHGHRPPHGREPRATPMASTASRSAARKPPGAPTIRKPCCVASPEPAHAIALGGWRPSL